jgi:hypothetical protein
VTTIKNNMEKLLGKPRQIDNRNRITLTPEILKPPNLKPGDKVYFKIKENNNGKSNCKR